MSAVTAANTPEIIRRNIEQAKQMEEKYNADQESYYQAHWKAWVAAKDVRAAIGLDPDPEPQPGLFKHITFDVDNLRIVEFDGPEHYQKLTLPPPPPPPTPVTAKLGPLWPGKSNVCYPVPGETSKPGEITTFNGKEWVAVTTPFSGGKIAYWQTRESLPQ